MALWKQILETAKGKYNSEVHDETKARIFDYCKERGIQC